MRSFLIVIAVTGLVACSSGGSSNSGAASTPPKPVTSTPAPTTNPHPIVVPRSIRGTGILWKPVSEGNGGLVVLTPASYPQLNIKVIDFKSSRVLATLRYAGRTNGNRPTYRLSVPGRVFKSPAVLKVGSKYYLIPQTSQRQE